MLYIFFIFVSLKLTQDTCWCFRFHLDILFSVYLFVLYEFLIDEVNNDIILMRNEKRVNELAHIKKLRIFTYTNIQNGTSFRFQFHCLSLTCKAFHSSYFFETIYLNTWNITYMWVFWMMKTFFCCILVITKLIL